MRFIDYYEVLQISPTASLEIIKATYRQLSKMFHPDISKQDNEKFILIREAYEVLSDKNKRNEYDEFRRMHLNQKKSDDNIKKANRTQKEFSNLNSKGNKTPFLIDRWIVVGVSILTISVMIFIYVVGNVEDDIAFYSSVDDSTSEIYDISLPVEEYSNIKTTGRFLNSGDAFFEIYNGTNLTIKSITIEVNVMNDIGEVIDTRQFQQEVDIDPFSVQDGIVIATGIHGLPAEENNALSIQPQYISWSYIEIIADNLE